MRARVRRMQQACACHAAQPAAAGRDGGGGAALALALASGCFGDDLGACTRPRTTRRASIITSGTGAALSPHTLRMHGGAQQWGAPSTLSSADAWVAGCPCLGLGEPVRAAAEARRRLFLNALLLLTPG